ncbi:MAG: hypothetical protein GF393_06845, partial [Armatimonadia bacterium]|nr:hypothetical protein [Armatimonadia bacterium]
MLRPWLAALALLGCGLISLIVYAWSVDFRAPEVVRGLAEGAANVRLEGIAMGLHSEAAEMRRAEVKRLRAEGASASRLLQARLGLADELRDAAVLAEAEGDLDLARKWLTESAQAAPERVDLLCLLTDMRTRGADPEERRMAFLRLVYEHDAPCALLLAGESFVEAGNSAASRAYLERAVEGAPQWAGARLALARLDLRQSLPEAAVAGASEAFQLAQDLPTRLRAAAVIEQAGGTAPPRWEI